MGTNLQKRIQASLEDKRRNLLEWAEKAPESEIRVCLGPECKAADLGAHIEVIDDAIEKAQEGTLGICEICRGYVDTSLLEMDYTSSICLDHYSEEEKRQLETELELSVAVQRALLPQQTPDIPGLQLAAFSRPAQIVGGDYYDFFQFRDGLPGLAIADVEGHGVSSSLLMSSLHTSLRTLAPDTDSPADVLQRINHFYLHNINLTTFVTVFLGRFDPATGSFIYASAGHNPPLVVHAGQKSVSWLAPTGAAIGLMEEYLLKVETVSLSPGDILLFYTDGVTEAEDHLNQQFGNARLAQLVGENADLPASDLLLLIRRALNDFTDGRPPVDDTTLIVCKVLG
jgi:sigma-B regulation protein RsbU (phosphoserine phosphatase)